MSAELKPAMAVALMAATCAVDRLNACPVVSIANWVEFNVAI